MKKIISILIILLAISFSGCLVDESQQEDTTLSDTQSDLDTIDSDLEEIEQGLNDLQIEDLEKDMDLGLS